MPVFDGQHLQPILDNGFLDAKPTTTAQAFEAADLQSYELATSISIPRQRWREYGLLIDEAKKVTGQDLSNPVTTSVNTDEGAEEFFKEWERLRVAYPGLTPRDKNYVEGQILEKRQTIKTETGKVLNRATGFAANAYAMAGHVKGVSSDPIVLGSMFVGAGAAAGVVRTALTELGIGLVSETAVQAVMSGQKREIGEKIDTAQVLTDIGYAGLGGFAIGGGIAALIKGGRAAVTKLEAASNKRRMHATGDVKAALNYLEAQQDLVSGNPAGAPHAEIHLAASVEAHNKMLAGDKTPGPAMKAQQRVLEEARAARRAKNLPEDEVRPGEVASVAAGTAGRVLREAETLLERVDVLDETLSRTQSGAVAASRKIDAIQAKLETATDRRKIKKLTRQLEEAKKEVPEGPRALIEERDALYRQIDEAVAEAEELKGIQQVAEADEVKLSRLEKKLRKRKNKLTGSTRKKLEVAASKIRKKHSTVEAPPEPQPVRPTAVERQTVEAAKKNAAGVRELLKGQPKIVVDNAANLAYVSTIISRGMEEGHIAPKTSPDGDTSTPSTPKRASIAEQDARVEETAQARVDEQQEAQFISELEQDPDQVFKMADDQGNTFERTAQEVLDEFNKDQKAAAAVRDCAEGAF
jgi:hypothetical protein